MVLTVNGRNEQVIQDAISYHKMVDSLVQADTIATIRRGLETPRKAAPRH